MQGFSGESGVAGQRLAMEAREPVALIPTDYAAHQSGLMGYVVHLGVDVGVEPVDVEDRAQDQVLR